MEKNKNINLTKDNLNDKNKASLITIIVEIIKLFIVIIINIDLKIKFYILMFSIITIITSIIVFHKNKYSKILGNIFLEFVSIIYLLSNIYCGWLILKFLLKYEKKTYTKLLKEKKEIKKLEIKSYHKTQIYFVFFLLFWFFDFILDFPNYIFSITAIIISLLLFKNEIKESIEHFKMNKYEILKIIIKNIFIFNTIGTLIGIILINIVGDISTNEIVLANNNYIIISLMAIFWAPIVEEIVFRGCIRKFIKKDIIFIIISSITFGAYHVLGYNQELIQYLYIILYSVSGVGLSLTYTKTNNIFACMIMHFIMNLIATLLGAV